ncbi:MAG TPA: hypothetical protein VFL15_02800 [Gammaproteobacteria bacterium]|nr:hypothetical protein [Gammaproteobacteria bacterium]
MKRGALSGNRSLNYGTVAALIFAALLTLGPTLADTTPQTAERFTHLLGVNLADGIDFNTLAKRFGASPVSHTETGDASNTVSRVCYRSADGRAVVLFAAGDVDYQFVMRNATAADSHCPVSRTITATQLNVAGIMLGMPQNALEALLGKPVSMAGGRLTYQFQYVHTLTDDQIAALIEKAREQGYDSDKPADMRNWNVVIYIQAAFTQDRLASLLVDRVETKQ